MSTRFDQYDFVFLGAGCASTSLLLRLLTSDKYKNARVLIIDVNGLKGSDRTWCFWEKEEGYFESLLEHKWPLLQFSSEGVSLKMDISPYQYKMIRSEKFYAHSSAIISSSPFVDVITATVSSYKRSTDNLWVELLDGSTVSVKATYVFNSIFNLPQLASGIKKGSVHLLQHFKGWFIETKYDCFNTKLATLMDFTVPQDKGTAFVYLLPIAKNKALVEYTLFSASLLKAEEYEQALKTYLSVHLKNASYNITETEFGVIPMNDDLHSFYSEGVYQIGSIGGLTKGSTGFTFQFIQQKMQSISQELIQTGAILPQKTSCNRFHFYDSILLQVLANNYYPGSKIFARLFSKNKPLRVLQFLDNQTTLSQEISIISKLPWLPFLKGLFKKLMR